MLWLTRALAVLSLAVLVGCSGVKQNATYDGVEDLRKAYLKADDQDTKCEDTPTDLTFKYGFRSVNCGLYTILFWFDTKESQSSKFAQLSQYKPEHMDSDNAIITGDGWAIYTNTSNAEQVHKKLGGTLEQGQLPPQQSSTSTRS